MKSYIKLFTVALVAITFSNCKNNEVKLSEYKYADKTFDMACNQIDTLLLKEAVFSFEDDISNFFERNGRKNLAQAYSKTVNLVVYKRAQYRDMVSDHTREVFDILKTQNGLWHTTTDGTTLNYDHPFVQCLASHIQDKDIKTTFNALLSTNSMRQDIFADAIRRKSSYALRDRYLATYIALDLYYGKLFDVDFTQPKKTPVKGNRTQTINKSQMKKKVKMPKANTK